VLPETENISLGAVPYSPSNAFHDAGNDQPVTIHPLIKIPGADHTRKAEAAAILEIINAAKAQNPEAKIAVLVRSRSTLSAILPQLRKAGLPFLALDIEHLGERQVVQDLLALTRA